MNCLVDIFAKAIYLTGKPTLHNLRIKFNEIQKKIFRKKGKWNLKCMFLAYLVPKSKTYNEFLMLYGTTEPITTVALTCALVRHLVVEGIRPKWWINKGSNNSCVVYKSKFLHHKELPVPPHC